MLTKEQNKIYMSLSNDPNERGRLWKNHPAKCGAKGSVAKRMQDYYDKMFIKKLKETLCKKN